MTFQRSSFTKEVRQGPIELMFPGKLALQGVPFARGPEFGCLWFWCSTILPSCFCKIPISPGRIGQTMERSKLKSTQPSPGADETPCSSEKRVAQKIYEGLSEGKVGCMSMIDCHQKHSFCLIKRKAERIIISPLGSSIFSLLATEVLALKHKSMILGQWSNPVSGWRTAKPVLHWPNSTDPTLFCHGETTYRAGWMSENPTHVL